MNIVFFSKYFYPHVGGVEKHVLKISEILAKKHSVTVVTEQYDRVLPLTEKYKGIVIHRIPYMRSGKEKKYEIWRYFYNRRVVLLNADVIHAHDVFFWYFPFRFMYPAKPIYTTFHGYEGNSLPTKKAIVSHKIAEKLSHGNICIGDFLKKWYGTKPTIVSYGAVEPIKHIRKQQLIGKKKIKAVYIGRLKKEAGIIDYLQLIKKLKDSHYSISLVVLGDGSQLNQAKTYAKKYGLTVSFKGFVPHSESYMQKSDVVFTSRYLGILEGMVQKKPVLAIYNNEIKKDYFEMAPFREWIYVASSVSELYNHYVSIMNNDKKQEQKIAKAYSWVKNQTWEKMAKQYVSLWMKKR